MGAYGMKYMSVYEAVEILEKYLKKNSKRTRSISPTAKEFEAIKVIINEIKNEGIYSRLVDYGYE